MNDIATYYILYSKDKHTLKIENIETKEHTKYYLISDEDEENSIKPNSFEKVRLKEDKNIYQIYKKLDNSNHSIFPTYIIEYFNGTNKEEFAVTNDFTVIDSFPILKYTCSHCDKLATWDYMPSFVEDNIITPKDSFFCDDHVNKFCSCNSVNISDFSSKEGFIEYINQTQSKYPSLFNKDNSILINKKENIILFIENSEERTLKEFTFNDNTPCCEYDYSQNGFAVYEDINYSFSVDLE